MMGNPMQVGIAGALACVLGVAAQCNPEATPGAVGAGGSTAGEAGAGLDAAAGGAPSGGSGSVGGSGGAAPDAGTDGGFDASGDDASADASTDAPSDAAPPCVSASCGDGCWDPLNEECDDGNQEGGDLCSPACVVSDLIPDLTGNPDGGTDAAGIGGEDRRLGQGRHPVATTQSGFAVAYITGSGAPVKIEGSLFSKVGVPISRLELSAGSTPVTFADPVLAALPETSSSGAEFITAYTEFDGDGDELGIALRKFNLGGQLVGPIRFANQLTDFSQSAPDLAWINDELVVGWVDTSNPFTAPDLRWRRFDRELRPLADESTLAATQDSESHLVLEEVHGGVGLAYRRVAGTSDLAREVIEVSTPNANWTVGPFPPGPTSDHPALVELDSTHVLVAFTYGADGAGTGIYNTPRVALAILDVGTPGTVTQWVDLTPAREPYASDSSVGLSEPTLTRSGPHVFLSWRSDSVIPSGEELWLQELAISSDAEPTLEFLGEELPAPRAQAHQLGDQRGPALAGTSYVPGDALALAWVDYGQSFGEQQGTPDVVVQLSPLPLKRVQEVSQALLDSMWSAP